MNGSMSADVALHHRIGGLENGAICSRKPQKLHHRIGGLEKKENDALEKKGLHHRIGGLEIIN